ncbi:MAG: biosynthetic-type acetolactate synthase large subunit [Gudongella sp.]|jgi:acetolactate synthase-1/2/3 large subunit|nr:biosynthetic-type acetolactate synthase large subunit [Gudongella sp.]
MRLKGAEVVMECLLAEGVDTIFGYPGGAVIPLYDAYTKYSDRIMHILTSHEQGASHAADGYARSSGKVGVCIATSGPGATNTVTGIATAYADSVPVVVITGQVASALLGRDSFQEVDITALTMSITKHNYQVRSVDEIAEVMHDAFRVANSGRKGPVLVDIPKDLMMTETEYSAVKLEESEKVTVQGDFEKLAEMIAASERPVIYSGGGVVSSGASKELLSFAEKCDIPVANSLMGLGGFPRNHRLSIGLMGMHGFKETNLAVTSADLIIAVGSRFSDRVIGDPDAFGEKAKLMHLDIDGAEIGKNKAVDGYAVGDLKEVLLKLTDSAPKGNRQQWLDYIHTHRDEQEPFGGAWSAVGALKLANSHLEDSVVVTDVGQHQMWTAQHWMFKEPRHWLSSGGLGTMGYGLGAAIGAQVALPDKNVVLVTGDGSFRMNCNELGTVARFGLPVTILLFNNSTLGMVRQWQGMFCDDNYSQTDLGDYVDFIKLAGAYGIEGKRVEGYEELDSALLWAKESRRTVVIECRFSKDQFVYPIVPAGKAISEMILERSVF